MGTLNPLLVQLRESQDFRIIMADLLKSRPLVPAYTPQKTRDLTEHLIENIKHESSSRQGWDLLYVHLTGSQPPE